MTLRSFRHLGLMAGMLAVFCMAGTGVVLAASTTSPETERCRGLIKELQGLEDSGILKYFDQTPTAAIESGGQALVGRIRRYISVSETVLFKCPLGLRKIVSKLDKEDDDDSPAKMPPLPVKSPGIGYAKKKSLFPKPLN